MGNRLDEPLAERLLREIEPFGRVHFEKTGAYLQTQGFRYIGTKELLSPGRERGELTYFSYYTGDRSEIFLSASYRLLRGRIAGVPLPFIRTTGRWRSGYLLITFSLSGERLGTITAPLNASLEMPSKAGLFFVPHGCGLPQILSEHRRRKETMFAGTGSQPAVIQSYHDYRALQDIYASRRSPAEQAPGRLPTDPNPRLD